MKNLSLDGLALSLIFLMTGCASTTPAPLVDRSPAQDVEKSAVVEVKPGYYMVRKGDTLRSIALDHGQDYRDISTWNNLENPNLIKVGQLLRVIPPEGEAVAETRAIAPPTQIETRPTDGRPSTTVDILKREPKGGTQLYSNESWAQTQKSTAATAAPIQAKPTEQGQPAAKATVASDIDWAWPSSSKVTTPFSDGGSKGLDFDGKLGDPVLAAAAGKVTLVTNSLRGYGNLIVVKHNASYLSVYAHNSKMLVAEGQTVTRGQKIAELGSTDTDRPNLHFEIRREGKPVDPAKFLPQR